MSSDLHTIRGIIELSLFVSVSATFCAAAVGIPAGILMAVHQFRFRRALIIASNALLGLPPVVVGLSLYLVLSRSGPAGFLGLLYTPAAMILAQFMLALPIVTALVHRAMATHWQRYRVELLISGAGLFRRVRMMFAIGRADVATAVLAGFGRTISEVGAILIVGGNIAGVTRTMTTAIALETSEGHFGEALILGVTVIAISLAVSGAMFAVSTARGTRT